MTLAGKTALVTGSSRGIGKAIAVEFARRGADVAVNYRRTPEGADDAVKQIEALGRRAIAVSANMASPEEIEQLFAVIGREFGGLDILVCNAAAGLQTQLADAPLKAWDLAMNVNARSYLLCAQRAFPMMKARGGGRILALTANNAVERAFPNYGTVAASKAVINVLTVYLAAEFGPHNIIVNAISPGMVATEALAYFEFGAEARRRGEALTPSGRITTTDDVAHLAAFLASDEAHQINGQIIEIDGGYTRLFQ